jgi:hypothetical protein
MENYRKSLTDAIEDNKIELVAPSCEYNENEIIWMRGYNQALQDMLEDFDNDFENFLNEMIKTQLN